MKPSDKPKFDKSVWDVIFGKLKKLGTAIEMYYGEKMNIDEPDYRLLSKEEMSTANDMWRQYGKA